MAAEFVSVSAVPGDGRTGSTTIPAPSGIVDGRMLVLVFSNSDDSGVPPTLPSGFEPCVGFPQIANPGGVLPARISVGWKIAASESGDYVVTHGGPFETSGFIFVVDGAAGTPHATFNDGFGQTTTASSITTATANALVAFVEYSIFFHGSLSPPSGTSPAFTERFDPEDGYLYLATGVLDAAGATGDKSIANTNTGSSSLYTWAGVLIAVEAASEPPVNAGFISLALLGIGGIGAPATDVSTSILRQMMQLH